MGDIENNTIVIIEMRTWGQYGVELLRFTIMLILVFVLGLGSLYVYQYYFV